MRISTFVIAMMLMSGLVLGSVGFLVSLPRAPNTSVDTSFNTSFNKLDKLINQTQDIQTDVFNAQPTETNVLVLVGTGIVKSLRGAFASIGVFGEMVSIVATESIGYVPAWVFDLLLAIVTFLFLMALIYAFGGRDA